MKRLLRLFRLGRRVSKYIEYTTTLLLVMMFSFALLSHWLACIWYVIGYKEVQVGELTSWLYRLGILKFFIQFSAFIERSITLFTWRSVTSLNVFNHY